MKMFSWNRRLIYLVKMHTPAKINDASDLWWNICWNIYGISVKTEKSYSRQLNSQFQHLSHFNHKL